MSVFEEADDYSLQKLCPLRHVLASEELWTSDYSRPTATTSPLSTKGK
jgi:hypothetical protein